MLWATQRLDELRGFAGAVTLMSGGVAAFDGTVEALAARAVPEARPPPRVRARAGLPRRRPGSRMSAAGLAAEAAKLPAFVRRDWKIALSYRAVFVGEALASRCRSSSSSSSRSSSTRASCPPTAGRCRAISRSSSIGLVVNLTAGVLLHTRSRPRCARSR